jgi:hypothetical protein
MCGPRRPTWVKDFRAVQFERGGKAPGLAQHPEVNGDQHRHNESGEKEQKPCPRYERSHGPHQAVESLAGVYFLIVEWVLPA